MAGQREERPVDVRRQQLDDWVSGQLGEPLAGEPASSDASFRRYFRYYPGVGAHGSVIAMDAPPEQENCRPFVQVAALLREVVWVPEILAEDQERGFLLLTDLGTTTLLQALQRPLPQEEVRALYARAWSELLQLQQLPCPDSLPRYGEALLRQELELFPQWYVQRHLGRSWGPAQREDWRQLTDLLCRRAQAQAQVLVHRDYMPRNLMVGGPRLGIIDFQDAVCGPISYDPVSLLEDAFLSWPREVVVTGLRYYWRQAAAAGLPVPGDWEEFVLDCDLMAVQRHLKVVGIFARIHYRDGKPHYFADVQRFLGYLRGAAGRRPELLAPLDRLLDWVEQP